jgi:hypothetical protein
MMGTDAGSKSEDSGAGAGQLRGSQAMHVGAVGGGGIAEVAPADVRVNVVVVNCALSGLKRPRASSALNARDQYEVFAGRANAAKLITETPWQKKQFIE